jgi:hypothetical protein
MKDEIIKIAKDLEQGTITETQAQNLLLVLFDVSNCTHENTSFKHIRCNVCDDCGDVIEIDV